ncbi:MULTISPECIES: hypothetical protein [Sphingomonas]|jgi:hypothetical protein|uniref:Peptidase S74 domain-containing protein n=1 Tax=Sphingomonas zeae TaxID=1646122 RepID=A0A7Y6EFQ8_9SPHN|nr:MULTISPECIES: hypothetical protein [Sphingomonas]MBB4049631.1 hypothetical protein [Sphingomonas zeae]MDK8187996.1 hypothetical protein [Sphingomonas zeae]MDK8217936.1 hypothetical protein [Sphingomonas sp. UMB7805-LC452B]NUU46013.1 hypothetical protein [Sphingomonas zeae]
MAWYRAGTVAVTNGSAVIAGSGTAWVNNVQIGHAINLPDGRAYEVLSVDSNTQITLGSPYLGVAATGQAYSVQPNQGFAQAAAAKLTDFLSQISGWISGALSGRFGDGTSGVPGISFAVDQDTGLYRGGANVLGFSVGGVGRAALAPDKMTVNELLEIGGPSAGLNLSNPQAAWTITAPANANALAIVDRQTSSERARFDAAGNLLVGATSASNHVISRGTSEGDLIMQVQGKAHPGVAFFSAASGSANSSACAFALNKNAQTNRSINAAGTINGSGADYAEYMLKAAGCGIIAKGDVCGVDREGKLTRTWADAISFVVKSTDPTLVGGDTWAAHLPPRPEQGEDEAAATFASRLTEWETALEQARLCVDRIAFCGQVPCNVSSDFEVGDYIVAAASGAGIKAVAVKPDDITFPEYMRRIGKVWAIREGRAWIDVQHG